MAVPASWVWVLVGCFSVAVAEDSSISTLYPPLWEESPEQLNDYRLEDGKHIINPWVFTDRMGLYRILLNQTATYFARYGPENEQNILWGLPMQFGWQYKTGRLADPTGGTDCGYEHGELLCVSVDSWWAAFEICEFSSRTYASSKCALGFVTGCGAEQAFVFTDVNYFLSVVPFLAAVDSGILGISSDQITISPPPLDQMKFCYNISDCRELLGETIDNWTAFFKYMQLPSSDFDGLLKHLWAAHTSSLEYPVVAFAERYTYYSDQEANFEENWAIAVTYLAAAYLPTTLYKTHRFQEGLPPHVLSDTDIAPFIANFTSLQNEVLLSLTDLGDIDKLTGSLSLTAWEFTMSSKPARELFLKAFEEFLGIST